ncbi:MAG: hypothetical protein M1818_005858 [Claussenomyces sp. TS43310]|nr:MAG: hypothetical protein M1818_005858 [Claussenomyces sp. TS43310]
MAKSKSPITKNADSTSPQTVNASPPQADAAPTTRDVKIELTANADAQKPLAAPPRPQSNDYFSTAHAPQASHLSFEPNPFEHSFGGGGVETPGGTKLPSVAALTSPAPLLPGGGSTPFTWGSSLRTGPLSPAMLSGPTGDYFGDSHHLRGGFPTPNESSLRTGLTPGGGGSMFPAPSPNSQALFNQLASGGATPSTLDFHRTAMNAAAAQKRNELQAPHQQQHQSITSQPQDMLNGHDSKPPQQQPNSEMFGQHDANDAANGLFMLASQSRNGSQNVGQYAMAQQQPVHAHPPPAMNMAVTQPSSVSPTMANRNGNGSMSTGSGRGVSEMSANSDESEQNRPTTRGKGKKGAANGRRKAEETPSKGPAAKKSKANNGNAPSAIEPEPPSEAEEEHDMSKDEYNANGKKMTDEEKRKNFLERNRVAALKCRQRKKQWLANLQQKVEIFSSENDSLSQQISQLREEVVNLKTLLLAHKDCPVTQQQGLGGMQMNHIMADYGNQMQNPYGMAMNGQQVMAGQGMQGRRFS